MDDFLDLIDRYKILFWSNILLFVSWLIFAFFLVNYNSYLETLVPSTDGWIVRAFKLIFSGEVQHMGLLLIISIILIACLVWAIVAVWNNFSYEYSTYYLWTFGVLLVLDLIGLFVTFCTILAPILLSFAIVGVAGIVAVFAMDNDN